MNRCPIKLAEKRANKTVNSGPDAKRAAFTDISSSLSSVLIDSTKKNYDQKLRLRSSTKVLSLRENDENAFVIEKPTFEPPKPVKEVALDPCPDFDFDKECAKDLFSVADYARDIFLYYTYRQNHFAIGEYMKRQRHITREMRAHTVNWLIAVQEQFELNHETLYLAVKIMDIYLDRTKGDVRRGNLQLIAGSAVFLASKFDERVAPLIDDIIYMCQDSYTPEEVLKMEMILFRTVGYDLGIPLSYRFLRRFSRVIKADMNTLTLARYVLETSLMFYDFVCVKDDLMAAAALLLALKMKKLGDWDARLVKYSGYRAEQVEELMWTLNHMIIKRRVELPLLDTIFLKYSHEIFFEVALTDSLEDKFPLSEYVEPPLHLRFQC